ncbi:hypothetical protein H7097_04240 [Aeromicrobium sp.]|nr:hypothetical protein [Candidatus Saccharibacteria bacterium]
MRYVFGFLATIGLIILILVLLLRGGGGGDSTPVPKSLVLAKYAQTGSSAEFIIDGPIVSDPKHQELKIRVSADSVTYSLYSGYQGDLIKQTSYPNNTSAYTVFLKSLQNEGFTKGNTDKQLTDERGVCPLGQRRIYSFDDSSKSLMRFWSTSCGTKTFEGRSSNVATLFRNQVPDYGTLSSNTEFSGFY